MTKAKKEAILGLLFVLPSFLIIVFIVAIPVCQSIVMSFISEETGKFTFENYILLFTDPYWVDNILYTLNIVLWTTFLNTIISYALATYLVFGNSRTSRLLNKLYIIPRFIPGIVAVYAMMSFVRDTGAINRAFMTVGLDVTVDLMYTPEGIILTNLWLNIPFATMIIAASMGDIPSSIIESAKDVGAKPLTVFRSMIFPLSSKAVLMAATFVFMGNVGSFTTPFLMGANSPRMLGVALYNEFKIFFNLNTSAALSVVMFLMSSVMGGIYIYYSMKENKWESSNT